MALGDEDRDEDRGDERGDGSPVVDWGNQGWEEPAAPGGETPPEELPPTPPTPANSAPKQKTPPKRKKGASRSKRSHDGYDDSQGTVSRKDRKRRQAEVNVADASASASAGASPGTASASPASGPLFGRGLLMLAAAGYLFLVAFLCYDALGGLHADAVRASGARLVQLRHTHVVVTLLLLANVGGGALFALAGLLLLAGQRGFGKTLVFFGAVFLIGFVYLNFKHALPYLRELDVLLKLIIISVASLSVR